MANLGDYFPEDIRDDFAVNSFKPGVVLRFFVTDTTPPKVKRLIIIAVENNEITAATLFINSEINPEIINSEELRKLQYKILAADCNFLDHDSYIDCSSLKERTSESILKLLRQSSKTHLGELNPNDFAQVKKLVKEAKTIPLRVKKKFGLFF